MGSDLAVMEVGAMDENGEQKSHGIDENVAFSARHLFASIVASRAAHLRGLHALSVDNRCRRARWAPRSYPGGAAKHVGQPGSQPGARPPEKVVVDGFPRRIVLRQKSPLATGSAKMEDRVDNLAGVMLAKGLAGKEKFDTLPLGICQIRIVHRAVLGVL